MHGGSVCTQHCQKNSYLCGDSDRQRALWALVVNRWHLSITHDAGVAVATVIAEHLSPDELELARRWEESTWS